MNKKISGISVLSFVVSIVAFLIMNCIISFDMGFLYGLWLLLAIISPLLPYLAKFYRISVGARGKWFEYIAIFLGVGNLSYVLAARTSLSNIAIDIIEIVTFFAYFFVFSKGKKKNKDNEIEE